MLRIIPAVLLWFAASMPAAAQIFETFKLRCPRADSVVRTPIPHSVNSLFTAKSGDFEFWSYGAGWLPDARLFQAALVPQGNGTALSCTYGTSQWQETLLSQDSAAFDKYCWFPGSRARSCHGSIEECTLECLFPAVPDPAPQDVVERSVRPRK